MDGDDALVRRIVDAATIPALLARDGATALLEACDAQAVVLFVRTAGGQIQLLGPGGSAAASARVLAAASQRQSPGLPQMVIEPIGRSPAGQRSVVLST